MKLLGITTLLSLLIFSVSLGEPQKVPMVPQGNLVLVGGGNIPISAQDKFLELSGGENARIVCVTSASPRTKTGWWATQKIRSLKIVDAKHRSEAYSYEFSEPVRHATGLWFTGGDQTRLMNLYDNTLFEREVQKLFERGGTIGGTSAGASIVTEVMMDMGRGLRGLGLLDRVIVDQHFSERKRLSRLLNLLNEFPGLAGIGIDEDTAVIISKKRACVIGNGSVTFCEGQNVTIFRQNENFQIP